MTILVIFSLRLYSIYGGSKIVLFSVVALLVAEIAIKIVGDTWTSKLFFLTIYIHYYSVVIHGREKTNSATW